MGKNFCVCNEILNNGENESNIFSVMNNNKHLEKETIKTLNSENQIIQNSMFKTIQDDISTNNNGFSSLLYDMYKNNNSNKSENNNKLLSEINKNDNFQCSGKFNVLQTNSNIQIANGGNDNNENNSSNNNDSKNINNNINGGNLISKNKNELGFISFKSFNVEPKENKDNNTNNSNSQKIENNLEINNSLNKYNIIENGNSGYIDTQKRELKLEKNGFSICKDNNINFPTEKNNNLSEYRYNNISQYSDVSENEDYLNYESNYYNSNKREENRDNQSLFDEESENR